VFVVASNKRLPLIAPGVSGVELLPGLLAWDPAARLTAEDALRAPYFNLGRFPLAEGAAGNTLHKGYRHDYRARVGVMFPEILEDMFEEAELIMGPMFAIVRDNVAEEMWPTGVTLQDNLDETTVPRKHLNDYAKVVISTKVGANSPIGSQCGVPLAPKPFLQTVGDYLEAMREKFRAELNAIDGTLKRRLRDELDDEDLEHLNTVDFLANQLVDAFLAGCQTQGKQRTHVHPSARFDPNHFDGSQSLLHVGLTTAGERDVVLWEENPTQHKDDRKHLYWPQGEPPPNLVLKQKPGSVYIGVLTGAAHQVRHAPLEASPPEYYIGSEGEASHPKKLATRT
jgi:hypothetical protein